MVRVSEKFLQQITLLADDGSPTVDASDAIIVNSSGMVLNLQSSVPGGTPSSGQSTLWIKDPDGYAILTDSAGNDVVIGEFALQTLEETLIRGNETNGQDIRITNDTDFVLSNITTDFNIFYDSDKADSSPGGGIELVGQENSGGKGGSLSGSGGRGASGGNITWTGGIGDSNIGSGGGVSLIGGAGTAGTSADGGDAVVNAGDANGSGSGGAATLTSGSSDSGSAGSLTIEGGSSNTGTGGTVSIRSGSTNGSSASAGDIQITAGDSTNTGFGGDISLTAGDGSIFPGSITMIAGSGGTAGNISLLAGNSSSDGGDIRISTTMDNAGTTNAGNIVFTLDNRNSPVTAGVISLQERSGAFFGTTTTVLEIAPNGAGTDIYTPDVTGSAAGDISLSGGSSSDGGGSVILIGGDNSGSSGNPGYVKLTGGAGTANNENGGYIDIDGGAAHGSGTGGGVFIHGGDGGATGAGGSITIQAGSNSSLARTGDLSIRTSTNSGGGDSGVINISTGYATDNSSGVNSGYITISTGDSWDSAGNINLTGGDSTVGDGADVILTPGDGSGVSTHGSVLLRDHTNAVVAEVSDRSGLTAPFTVYTDVDIQGKLTVSGLIDPTGMVFDLQSSVPGGNPAAGKATLWIRDSDGSAIITDSAGNNTVLTSGGNETLEETLALGNTTGDNDIVLSGTGSIVTADTTSSSAKNIDIAAGSSSGSSGGNINLQPGTGTSDGQVSISGVGSTLFNFGNDNLYLQPTSGVWIALSSGNFYTTVGSSASLSLSPGNWYFSNGSETFAANSGGFTFNSRSVTSGTSPDFTVNVGSASSGASGGDVNLNAGDVSSGAGDGGAINITAGVASTGTGGNVNITPGSGTTSAGNVVIATDSTDVVVVGSDNSNAPFEVNTDGYFYQDLEIGGKLTVGGLIDPTGMVFDLQSSVPGGTPAAGKATLWIRDTDGYAIITDENGINTILSEGGGGGGGSQTLSQTLDLGNTTGSNDIILTSGYSITAAEGDDVLIQSADIAGSGTAGDINILAGDCTNGTGGSILIEAGAHNGGTAAGNVTVKGGDDDSGEDAGGDATLQGGTGATGGDAIVLGGVNSGNVIISADTNGSIQFRLDGNTIDLATITEEDGFLWDADADGALVPGMKQEQASSGNGIEMGFIAQQGSSGNDGGDIRVESGQGGGSGGNSGDVLLNTGTAPGGGTPGSIILSIATSNALIVSNDTATSYAAAEDGYVAVLDANKTIEYVHPSTIGGGGGSQTLAEVLAEGNDANSLNITGLADPVSSQDAATKGYVDGLIDPTGMVFDLQSSVPGGNPAAGKSTLWIRDSDGSAVLTDSAGNNTVLTSGGNETLGETLALGNTTGGNDIVVSSGDALVFTNQASVSTPSAGTSALWVRNVDDVNPIALTRDDGYVDAVESIFFNEEVIENLSSDDLSDLKIAKWNKIRFVVASETWTETYELPTVYGDIDPADHLDSNNSNAILKATVTVSTVDGSNAGTTKMILHWQAESGGWNSRSDLNVTLASTSGITVTCSSSAGVPRVNVTCNLSGGTNYTAKYIWEIEVVATS